MTEQTQPTDAELEALLVESAPILGAIGDRVRASMVSAMRVAFAKWGTPAGAGEPVAWVDERAISWLKNSRSRAASITTQLTKERLAIRPMALYTAAPQPTQAQAEAVPTREFLERTLAAMEGVIDVADRKTDEFDALRSCVIDLTLMLFKPGQHSTPPLGSVPLTDEQSHALLERMANEADKWAEGLSYEPTRDQLSGWCVAFILREIQAAHGIKGADHD